MSSDDIYRRAVERYGASKQLRKFQEECCEAGAATSHYMDRGGCDTYDALIDEIADVEITAAQMRVIFGDEDIDAAKARKLARLEARLGEEEER